MPGAKYSGGYLYNKTGDTLIYEFNWNTSTVQQVLNSQEAIAANVSEVSNTIGGQSLSSSALLSNYKEPQFGMTYLYDVTPEPETVTGFFLDGQEYVLGGSGGGEWGTITGTLSDQTDLQTALNAKVGSSNNTINNVVHLSQADYDALQNPDNNTWYSTPDNGSGGFDPENAGSVGQVVKKTSTGYGWGNVDSISTTQPANPVAGSTYFDTTSLTIKVYDGTQWKEVGSEGGGGGGDPVSAPGIYWNKKDGLISVSSDGTTWMTIADKNLGATEVFTIQDGQNGGLIDYNKQYGLLYQRGRNFPFLYNSMTYLSTQVPYADREPLKFIAYNGDWISTTSNNLWGATTNTYAARRGPCPLGWHVPSRADLTQLNTMITSIGLTSLFDWPSSGQDNVFILLKFSPAGIIKVSSDGATSITSTKLTWSKNSGIVNFWLSDYSSNTQGYMFTTDDDAEGDAPTNYGQNKSTGAPIRPFKNEGVQPTTTWEVLYQPS